VSLHVYAEIEQGTEEWLDARRGIVTASVVGQLITARTVKPASNDYSRALTALLVAERITGWTVPTYTSRDMLRGTLDEPVARALYASHHAPVDVCGFMVRDDWGWRLGYSPDGLVGDDGLIEIKSRQPKEQLRTVLADEVPPENMAQIQCGLMVAGREWCDYVSFSGGMPLWTKRVLPDHRWRATIVEAVEYFEGAAEQMVAEYMRRVDGLPTTERIDHFPNVEIF
jgi:hypothetical protein